MGRQQRWQQHFHCWFCLRGTNSSAGELGWARASVKRSLWSPIPFTPRAAPKPVDILGFIFLFSKVACDPRPSVLNLSDYRHGMDRPFSMKSLNCPTNRLTTLSVPVGVLFPSPRAAAIPTVRDPAVPGVVCSKASPRLMSDALAKIQRQRPLL